MYLLAKDFEEEGYVIIKPIDGRVKVKIWIALLSIQALVVENKVIKAINKNLQGQVLATQRGYQVDNRSNPKAAHCHCFPF